MKKLIFLAIVLTSFSTLSIAQCKCGTGTSESRWDGIGFFVGDKPLSKYQCGYQFSVKSTEKIKFVSGGYNCVGTDFNCKAKISGVFTKGTTVVRNISSFNFTTEILEFTTPGSYKLELSALCKSSKCGKCTYFFTVN